MNLKLFEQALAAPGDCDFGEASYINGINKRALRSIKDPKFFRIPDTEGMFGIGTYAHDDNAYILFSVDYDAIDNRDRAKYLAVIQLEPLNDKFKLSRLGFNNIYKVSGVETDKKERYKGFGFLLYTLLLTEYKMDIMGDYMQYEGARNLWKKLSQTNGIEVSIINITNNNIYRDLTLDSNLEPNVWTDINRFNDIITKAKHLKTKVDIKAEKVGKNLRLIPKNISYKPIIKWLGSTESSKYIKSLKL